jgi:hypothetical protein
VGVAGSRLKRPDAQPAPPWHDAQLAATEQLAAALDLLGERRAGGSAASGERGVPTPVAT